MVATGGNLGGGQRVEPLSQTQLTFKQKHQGATKVPDPHAHTTMAPICRLMCRGLTLHGVI